MTMLLMLLHGEGKMDLVYFWSSILTVLLPLTVFIAMTVLLVKGYLYRKEADGGGPAPARDGTGRPT